MTADSRVKILDFGLAKLTAIEPSAAAVSTLPTVSAADAAQGAPDTLPGVVFGTVGYMSPEQVRGFPAIIGRHLLARRHPLRDAGGASRFPRRDGGRHDGRDPVGRPD